MTDASLKMHEAIFAGHNVLCSQHINACPYAVKAKFRHKKIYNKTQDLEIRGRENRSVTISAMLLSA